MTSFTVNSGRIARTILVALAGVASSHAIAFGERISFVQAPDGNIQVVLSGQSYPCTYGRFTPRIAVSGFNIAITEGLTRLGCPEMPGAQPFAYSDVVSAGRLADGAYSATWSFDPAAMPPVSATFVVAGGSLIAPVAPVADLWWGGASESGWGVNLAAQDDKLFISAFVYDASGNPTWLVMPEGRWDPTHTSWTGSFYKMHGSPLTSYSAAKLSAGSAGAGTFDFGNPEAATFTLDAFGSSLTKRISRFVFSPDPTVGSHAGLWWGGTGQDGWGLSLAQQGEGVFATWYSYGSDGEPQWLYMPGATKVAEGHYTGALYGTRSAPWMGATSFDGSQTRSTQVGTLDLVFRDAQAGTMTAIVNGVKVVNEIQRFRF